MLNPDADGFTNPPPPRELEDGLVKPPPPKEDEEEVLPNPLLVPNADDLFKRKCNCGHWGKTEIQRQILLKPCRTEE